MKYIQFSSRRTDIKVLVVVGFSAVAGWLLPPQFENSYHAVDFDALFAVPLALLVWCVFHLIELSRHGWKWAIAELTVVPIVWLLLMLALDVWLHHLWWPSEAPLYQL